MPIKIAKLNKREDKKGKEIAWLCDDSWRLPEQLKELEKWAHIRSMFFNAKKCYVMNIKQIMENI